MYTTMLSKVITAIKFIILDSGLWNRAISWLQCFAGTSYFHLKGR